MFKTGALISPPSDLDFSIKIPAAAKDEGVMLPHVPIIGKQKESNCTAWGSAYALEGATGVRLCKGGHYADREPEHWQGEGRYLREVCDTLKKHGTAKYGDYTPEYEVTRAQEHLRANLSAYRAKAAPYKLKAYARAHTAAQIEAALRAGYGVEFSGACTSFKTDKHGTFRMINPVYGYHAMGLLGREPGDDRYKTPQSWGTSFGKKGFCYVPVEDVLRLDDIWVLEPDFAGIKQSIIRRSLKKGMKGEDVRAVQAKLLKLGIDLGRWGADGSFGSMTEAGVKLFQKRGGIKQTGIVDAKTWEAIDLVV